MKIVAGGIAVEKEVYEHVKWSTATLAAGVSEARERTATGNHPKLPRTDINVEIKKIKTMKGAVASLNIFTRKRKQAHSVSLFMIA